MEPVASSNKYYRLIVIAMLVFYFCWESYWYFKVGLSFIKWHTHIMFPVYLFLLFFFILKLFKVPQKVLFAVTLFFVGLLFTEIILVVTGLNKTIQERLNGHYASMTSIHQHTPKTYYWIDNPGSTKHLRNTEFHFTRKINALGYSDAEWKVDKEKDEFRILCIGDSFTEGDGTHVDSSYVAFLRRKVQADGKNISVMNAGKCGSDPFFNYMNYKDRLLKFKPDLVIQTVSSNDMTNDIYCRGGLERFRPGYKLAFRQTSPVMEFFYAISYTTRIIFSSMGYDEQVTIPYGGEAHSSHDRKMTIDLFQKYASLAKKNGAQVVIVVQPKKREIENGYSPDMLKLAEGIKKNPNIELFDLREYFSLEIKRRNARVADYFWIEDGHHNTPGYEMMADGIHDFISKRQLVPSMSNVSIPRENQRRSN